MSKLEAAAPPATTIRDTLPPANLKDLEQPLATAGETPAAGKQQPASPEQTFQSREEAQIALAKQVVALLSKSRKLSPRKQKNLTQCVDTMEKQIHWREANARQLPDLLHSQTETHLRGMVLKETIDKHVSGIERASKKINKSRKTFRKITKGPLKRVDQNFKPQDILPTITED